METGFMPVGSATAIHQGGNNAGNGGVTNRVIRAPNLKRGKMEEAISDRIKLEAVFGLTVSSNAALDCDPFTEVVAYPAGCTVVLYNVRKKRQSHVLNASRKSVTCVTFSPDGRYLATGECGHAPAVRVWDLHDPTSVTPSVQVAEFPSHTHGVSCVAFSKSCKYLVSIGSQHDMIVNVWDWKAGVKLASNKVSSRVNSVSFAQDGGYFVTVGFRHVKFWYLDSRQAKIKEPVPLMGRSAILGTLKDNDFCAVCCGKDECESSTFAVTASGLLCEFNSRRLLDKWVELRTTSANCMAIGSKLIFIGCADGIIRCFSPNTLQFITTLPRPHYLGVDVNQGTNISHMFSHPKGAQYPDAVAITYDERNHKVTCVYNDHSLYVWDVRDIKRVGKCHSALYHAACIWGVDVIPPPEGKQPGGETRFITCSSDDTVRIWSMNGPQSQGQTNVYSNELEKVLYIDPELTYLKDIDLTTNSDKDKAKSYDDKTGVRCVRLSPDGVHIASGDRSGNIWIHRIIDGKCLFTLEAHDAEVLSLEYSPQTSDYSNTPRLLASASRDRLLHIFNRDQGYQIMQTLDDHSSSIMAVRFLNTTAGLQMVSCGADKTILFRTLVQTKDGYQFVRGHNASTRCTLYDMEIDFGGKHVLTACQDRNVRVYSSSNARHTKTFRATVAEDGTLIKVALDTSGIYLATSSTDKILCVYDYYSGECMATVCGHSEIVTGLKFTPDCEYLISASGDGCLFVWRMPHDMVITMRARLSQQAIRMGRKVSTSINGGAAKGESENEGSPPRDLQDYALRIGRLPSWAKKSLGDELSNTANKSPENLNSQPSVVSKWATRVQDKRLESDGSKDSSIDSGTDSRSATERRTYTKQRPKSVNLEQLLRTQDLFRRAKNYTSDTEFVKKVVIMTESPKNADLNRIRHHTDDSSLGSFKYEEQEGSEDHDGDIEDISDGERTSSSERNHNATTYYIDNNDSENTPSEFMVNAMDVEELRKSQRRSKRWKTTATTPEDASALSSHHVTSVGAASASSHVTSLSGSDDDDELSTPSGDNADRTLMDAVKKVNPIHKAYECLSGSEPDKFTHSTTSLSSQHMSRSITNKPEIRLMPPPQSVPPPKSAGGAGNNVSAETSRAREELQRRILETRRQLESVGYRSNLKSSQSTTDLSYGSNVKRQSSFNNKQQNLYGNYNDEIDLDSLNSNVFYDSLNYQTNNEQVNLNNNSTAAARKASLSLEVGKKKRGLFKNFQSLPVSPVDEECKWADKINRNITNTDSVNESHKRYSLNLAIGNDNGKSLVDSIKADTEKMINEIKRKYGDLDDIDTCEIRLKNDFGVGEFDERFDGNFSSDSLEDCSISQDKSCKNKQFSKKNCRKHTKKQALPRRCISDYEIYNEKPAVPAKPTNINLRKSITLPRNMPSDFHNIGNDIYRKTCSNESILSDTNDIFIKIGDETGFKCKRNGDMGLPNRHSSASFFLNERKRYTSNGSNESILSDESYDNDKLCRTNCNSLESILSDDSCTKSAPLEALFESAKAQIAMNRGIAIPRSSNSCYEFECKSYGSSPNSGPPNLFHTSPCDGRPGFSKEGRKSSSTVYGFDIPTTVSESPEISISVTRTRSMYETKRSIAYYLDGKSIADDIPRLVTTKTDVRSLKQDNVDKKIMLDNFQKGVIKSKSCTFDVVIQEPSRSCKMPERFSNVQKNLEKFEKQIKRNDQDTQSATKSLERQKKTHMEYVAHKPPKPAKRTSSVKLNNKYRNKTMMERAKHNLKEKTFDININEKKSFENYSEFQPDSLEVCSNENNNMSLDSLDNIFDRDSLEYNAVNFSKEITSEVKKFKNIERKIEIINKLVEMEEKRMLQEKKLKEIRMRPLEANIDDGKVKVLSQKFDHLAKYDSNNKPSNLQQNILHERLHNKTVIPKTDLHIDSENIESSSSSCTNSPKVFRRFVSKKVAGFNKPIRFANFGLTGAISRRVPLMLNVLAERNVQGQQQTSRIHLDPNDNQDDTLRRAISLSDLHQSKGYGGNTAGRLQVKREMSAVSSSAKSRAQQRYHNKNTNNMMRSSSVGRLNQQNSDSESDTAPSVSSNGRNNSRPNQSSVGVMRPTISSLNKVATARRGNTLQGAHSAMNLAVGMSAAGGNGSSSDGEGGERRKRNHGLSAKAREVTARLTRSTSRLNSEGTQSSEQLAASLSEQLRKTACKVSALYKTMQNEHPNSINELEQAMMETQAVLRATLSRSTDSGHGSSRGDSNSLEENAAMSMIEQYSDLLLSMMQNKVTQHPAVGPNSMPDS